MSSTWGNHLKLSLFGESHSAAVGIVIDGLPAGLPLDMELISREMARRAPGKSALSTARQEKDFPQILSGLFQERTTGTPLTAVIINSDTNSRDYKEFRRLPRPGHADYPAHFRYRGYQDVRGGGHFSGRLTAPLVFAGAICKQILAHRGIFIGSHILQIHEVKDDPFDMHKLSPDLFAVLASMELPVLNESQQLLMRETVLKAKEAGDSVGGIIECAVIGLEPGLGDPFFDSVESTLAHLLFSVPAVKGVSFGSGFAVAGLFGSQSNDPFYYTDDGKVAAKTNHNGGLLGGLTTGMPVLLHAAIKPTPSIAKEQATVNLHEQTDTRLKIIGRHDPCIVPRAVPVIESAAAIGLCDLLRGQKGWMN